MEDKTKEEIFAEATKGKYIFGSVDLDVSKQQHKVVYHAMELYAKQAESRMQEQYKGLTPETVTGILFALMFFKDREEFKNFVGLKEATEKAHTEFELYKKQRNEQ